jgi:hypothetical protein
MKINVLQGSITVVRKLNLKRVTLSLTATSLAINTITWYLLNVDTDNITEYGLVRSGMIICTLCNLYGFSLLIVTVFMLLSFFTLSPGFGAAISVTLFGILFGGFQTLEIMNGSSFVGQLHHLSIVNVMFSFLAIQ